MVLGRGVPAPDSIGKTNNVEGQNEAKEATHKMTCLSYFMYLAVATALTLGSKAFDKPQTQQGNTDDHVQGEP